MKATPIDDVRRAVSGRWLTPASQATALRVTTDSRDTRGGLYIQVRLGGVAIEIRWLR